MGDEGETAAPGSAYERGSEIKKDDPDLHPGGHMATDSLVPIHPPLDSGSRSEPASAIEAGNEPGGFERRQMKDMRENVEAAKNPSLPQNRN